MCISLRACAVLLIDGLGYLYYLLVVSSLRVCDRLATLLESMKESILALCCNFWFRQSIYAGERGSVEVACANCILARSLGFHAITN